MNELNSVHPTLVELPLCAELEAEFTVTPSLGEEI